MDFFGESSRVTVENSSVTVKKIRREPRCCTALKRASQDPPGGSFPKPGQP